MGEKIVKNRKYSVPASETATRSENSASI